MFFITDRPMSLEERGHAHTVKCVYKFSHEEGKWLPNAERVKIWQVSAQKKKGDLCGMKGNQKLIEVLNSLLADELSAINQYMVHSEMCANWGYGKLHERVEKRAIEEMKHAEKLIARILFLEGMPIVSHLKEIRIGGDIEKQLAHDHAAEKGAVEAYNEAIILAGEVRDFATREILEHILSDEDKHLDSIEELQDQIGHMSLPIFLTTQVG
ncbi:MAG: bacterioferritin [Dethiobacter sp.]|nr:bacterioferritin [Dethiobacter sp.]